MEVRNAWEYRRLFQEPSLCSTHVRGGLRGPKRINLHRGDDAISIRMPVAACSLEDESQPGDLRKVGIAGDSHFLCTFPVTFECVPKNSFHFYNLKGKTIFIWGKMKSSGCEKRQNRAAARWRRGDRDSEFLGRRKWGQGL